MIVPPFTTTDEMVPPERYTRLSIEVVFVAAVPFRERPGW